MDYASKLLSAIVRVEQHGLHTPWEYRRLGAAAIIGKEPEEWDAQLREKLADACDAVETTVPPLRITMRATKPSWTEHLIIYWEWISPVEDEVVHQYWLRVMTVLAINGAIDYVKVK